MLVLRILPLSALASHLALSKNSVLLLSIQKVTSVRTKLEI